MLHVISLKELLMKRLLCAVFVAVAAASLGFTQDLKFDGYVNSGLGVEMTSKKDANGDTIPQILTYGVDSERYIGRFRLNGVYTNADKTAGANFRFQVQGDGKKTGSANAPLLAYGYAWVQCFDMLTIKAGLVDDTTWQTADVIFNDDQNEGPGALARLSPVTGLDLGFGAYTGSYSSSSNNNFLPAFQPINWDEAKYTYYASYTMDKVFRLMASYRTDAYAPGNGNAYLSANTDDEPSQFLAELRILAVPKLTAVAVGQVLGLQEKGGYKYSDNGRINFYETLGYSIDAFGFGLNAAQYKSNADNTDLCLRFNPWISYALNNNSIVPRLDLVYFMGGNQDGTNYHRRGFKQNYNKDTYVINARPSVKFNLDPKTSFEIGDSFYYQQDGKDNNGNKPDTVTTNVIYIDMVVKF